MAPRISHNFPESCLQKLLGIIKHSSQACTNFHLLLNREKLSVWNGVAAVCCANYSRVNSCSSGSELGNIRTTLRVSGSSKLVPLLLPSWVYLHVAWVRNSPLLQWSQSRKHSSFSFGRHIFLKMDQSSSRHKTWRFKAIWKCLLSYSLYMTSALAWITLQQMLLHHHFEHEFFCYILETEFLKK